jgi:hypothetical protein
VIFAITLGVIIGVKYISWNVNYYFLI